MNQLIVFILEKKYKDKDKENSISVHGPFKGRFSANQYFEVAIKPWLDCDGHNLNVIPLDTPDMFDMDQKSWMTQFGIGSK